MEARFGRDFSRVRIHTDTRASESADAVGALAYTVGYDIAFASGRYAPHTVEGRGLLAHELVHTLQQEGRTGTLDRIAVDPVDSPAEHEAQAVATIALAGGPVGVVNRMAGPIAAQRAPHTRQDEWRRVGDRDRQVTLIVEPGQCKSKGKSSSDAGLDRSHAFFVIDLCRGHTAGQIGGDLNYQDVIDKISNALASSIPRVLRGQAGPGVLDALQEAVKNAAPRAVIHFGLQWRNLQIGVEGTGAASVAAGVTEAEAKAKVAHPIGPGQLGVEVDVRRGQTGKAEVTGTVTYTIAGSTPPQPDCDVCECTQPKIRHTCAERQVPSQPGPPAGPLFIPVFYEYAKADPRGNYTQCLQVAAERIQAGWTISRIEGRTSPEGPLLGRRPNGFEGNIALAVRRAQRADADLRRLLAARLSLAMRGREQIERALAGGYEVIGREPGGEPETAELFGSTSAGEVPRRQLLAHLRQVLRAPAANGVDPLVTAHVIGEDLADCMGPEVAGEVTAFRKKIEAETLTERDLEIIYPPLRRALIVLTPPLPTREDLESSAQAAVRAVAGTAVPCSKDDTDRLPVPPEWLFEGKCRPKAAGKP